MELRCIAFFRVAEDGESHFAGACDDARAYPTFEDDDCDCPSHDTCGFNPNVALCPKPNGSGIVLMPIFFLT